VNTFWIELEVWSITINELKQFLQQNGLKIRLVKAYENDRETFYTYEGYQGWQLLFNLNGFTVKKAFGLLDITGVDPWDVIEHFDHSRWLHSMFIEHEGVKPLEIYTEGRRSFIKALNLYGPPVIWSDHEGAKLQITTDNFSSENGYTFYLAGQRVAEITKRAIITPSRLGRPANLIAPCKASFNVRDIYNYIMDAYWPV
jgi:hypothetical protein